MCLHKLSYTPRVRARRIHKYSYYVECATRPSTQFHDDDDDAARARTFVIKYIALGQVHVSRLNKINKPRRRRLYVLHYTYVPGRNVRARHRSNTPYVRVCKIIIIIIII